MGETMGLVEEVARAIHNTDCANVWPSIADTPEGREHRQRYIDFSDAALEAVARWLERHPERVAQDLAYRIRKEIENGRKAG